MDEMIKAVEVRQAPAERPEWQTRVAEEHEQLDARIVKLMAFMDNDAFYGLSREQQHLMTRQLVHMMGYRDTLKLRIALFLTGGERAITHIAARDGEPERAVDSHTGEAVALSLVHNGGDAT